MYSKNLKVETVTLTWNIVVYPPIYHKPHEFSHSNDSGVSISHNQSPSF